MKTTLVVRLLGAAALTTATSLALGAPVNLLQNGSFESGLAGWTQSGSPIVATPSTSPVVVITYGAAAPYPTGASGEAVAPPAIVTASPDAAGSGGAYFVDDSATNQGLTQLVFLAAGTYRIGFDVYAPLNGYENASEATFSAEVAGVLLANYAVSTQPAATWTNYSALASIVNPGFYLTAFIFNTPGSGEAKDVVVDRAFIIPTDESGGRVIPEPDSLSLIALAFVGLAAARTRRKR